MKGARVFFDAISVEWTKNTLTLALSRQGRGDILLVDLGVVCRGNWR